MNEYPRLAKTCACLAAISLILIAALSCIAIGIKFINPEQYNITELSQGWTDADGNSFVLDSFTRQEDGSSQLVYRTITLTDSNTALMFRCRNMYANVYVNGELVSADKTEQPTIFGSSPGSRWHIIALNSSEQYVTICIEGMSCYSNTDGVIDNVYVGRTADLYRRITSERIGSFILSVFLQLVGVIILVLYVLLRNKFELGKDMLYLGSATFFSAQWVSAESLLWQLFFGYSEVFHLISYYSMVVIPVPFGMLAAERLRASKWHFAARIFTLVAGFNALIATFLHTVGILEFHYSLRFTHVLLVIMLPFMVMLVLSYSQSVRSIVKNIVVYVALITLILCILTAIIKYSIGQYNSYTLYIRIAIIAFLFCLIVYQFNQMADMFARGLRADMMHTLALTDYLTGLYNRTAFAEHKQAYISMVVQGTPFGIVQFDVNNLKKVNDNLGHEKGDQLLKCASEGFKKCFEDCGKIYRMGGDEFLVILDGKTPKEDYDAAIARLDAYCSEVNRRNDLDFKLIIAHGFVLDEGIVLEDALEQADARMYENKRFLKSNKL